MKSLRHTTAVLGTAVLLSVAAHDAYASNATVENTLRSHPELSSFYQGLVNTGVLAGLDPSTSYTIFAPTNKALAKISQEKYPCFYSQQCTEEVGDILRNHIISNPLQLGNGPDLSAAYSVNMEHLNLTDSSPSRNHENDNPTNYLVDGHRVLHAEAMGAGHLYEINGVIATAQQKMNVSRLKMADQTEVVLMPLPPTTTKVVQQKVYYAPDGAPDGVSQSTVTTEGSY
jgi:uncharacterized surface protein with fasciclin (FAS1) repeats